METANKGMNCPKWCWIGAAVLGLLVAIILGSSENWGFVGALFWGIVTFVVLGFLLGWLLCSGQTQDQSRPEAAQTAPPAAAEPAPAAAAEPAPVAPAAASAASAAVIKPSARLKGQEELAAKKGEYKYQAPAKAPAAKKAAAKKAPAAKKTADKAATTAKAPAAAKKAPAAAKPVAADGKPATLKAARKGGPDDLKQIKGVGPKMETLLNSMGFYHFDQIAAWRKKEVEWVDNNLEGFKGRVSRDEWVKQAKVLAKGGSTEFSKKVKKGGVY